MNQLTSKKSVCCTIDDKNDSGYLIESELKKLEEALKKSFKQEFIQSLTYLVRLENEGQSKFETNLNNLEWSKIEYFTKQFKKICKQKAHLHLLIEKMLIVKHETNKLEPSSCEGEAKTSNKKCSKKPIEDYSNLFSEFSDLNSCDYFSLTSILIRVLFKLIKSKLSLNRQAIEKDYEIKVFNLILVLLSSTADICYYYEARLKILSDPNFKCFLYIFATRMNCELIELIKTKNTNISVYDPLNNNYMYSIENIKKLWSKMCRLSANMFHEKYTQEIKDLYPSEFIASLCDFICHLQTQHTTESDNINMDDLEFYHSLFRFIKYACELTKFKNMILEKRLLVYLCRFMFKLNKKLVDLIGKINNVEVDKSQDKMDCENSNNSYRDNILQTDSKITSLKDLIKQHLLFLDSWPQPISTEYYNQLIEGNVIEHLLFIYDDENRETLDLKLKKPLGSSASSSSLSSLSSSTSSSSQNFNPIDYSFNLIYKLCRDCCNCRAEFGRHGGLSKYLNKIESSQSLENNSSEFSFIQINRIKEYEKLVEVICLCCKESVNRMRLREQSLLISLIKLQQKLRLNKNLLKNLSGSDTSLHNKLLVALCCFAHDTESMNVLLTNGLIDSLLAYLNESLNENDLQVKNNNKNEIQSKLHDLFQQTANKNKSISLHDLINNDTSNELSNCVKRKRKTSEPTNKIQISNSASNLAKSSKITKKQKTTFSSNDPLPPPLSPPFLHPRLISPTQNNNSIDSNLCYISDSICENTNQAHQLKSPSSFSYCDSLSPVLNAFSPTFSLSPPQNNNSRCNSAVMFQSASFYLPNQSPNSPSMTESMSPYLNWPNSVDNLNEINNIQFSPSIKNENSSDEEETEDIDIDNHTINNPNNNFDYDDLINTKSRKYSSSSSICELSFDVNNINSLKRSASIASSIDSSTTQHIESINRTEACVFYVLSQLTHGDKPSTFLINNFNNFDSILVSLLNYLKKAKIRNPRALRILNRLTKNQYCFTNFVLSHFPYKIKNILLDNIETISSHHNFKEKEIEKEMHTYLNSNKVFFDAHMFFPSFESIEYTLCNNLKSQCISSSDHGYLGLVNMMKQSTRKFDKISCALVAPFILRNSKALNYIMVHLNGIDTILDSLLASFNDIEAKDNEDMLVLANCNELKHRSVLCIKKILSFLNYKRNLNQVYSLYELMRKKFNDSVNDENECDVCFIFENEKKIQVNSKVLRSKSEYFGALLTSDFKEKFQRDSNNIQTIHMKEVSYVIFSIIIYLLGCGRFDTKEDDKNSKYVLTFELCYDLVVACDQFFLAELKDLFISTLICKFLSLSTWTLCFKLAYFINSTYLANATMDFLFSKLELFPIINKSDMKKELLSTNSEDQITMMSDEENDENTIEKNPTSQDHQEKEEIFDSIDVIEYLLSSLCKLDDMMQHKQLIIDYFRKVLKNGLIEIIKNNHWKL